MVQIGRTQCPPGWSREIAEIWFALFYFLNLIEVIIFPAWFQIAFDCFVVNPVMHVFIDILVIFFIFFTLRNFCKKIKNKIFSYLLKENSITIRLNLPYQFGKKLFLNLIKLWFLFGAIPELLSNKMICRIKHRLSPTKTFFKLIQIS